MSTVVLDASALLTLLRGGPGAKTVEGALGDALMPVVGMAEVASHFHHLDMPPALVARMLRPLPIGDARARRRRSLLGGGSTAYVGCSS